MQEKILLDEPGASLRAEYDGKHFCLIDRQPGRWADIEMTLTPAQAVEFAQWILATVPSICGKG